MLIDEKGRIWGRINIIDFGILLFIVVACFIFIKSCSTMPKMPIAIEKAKIEILAEEQEKFSKDQQKFRDEMTKSANRAKTMNDEMIRTQEIWYEGFKSGFAEGYSHIHN